MPCTTSRKACGKDITGQCQSNAGSGSPQGTQSSTPGMPATRRISGRGISATTRTPCAVSQGR